MAIGSMKKFFQLLDLYGGVGTGSHYARAVRGILVLKCHKKIQKNHQNLINKIKVLKRVNLII